MTTPRPDEVPMRKCITHHDQHGHEESYQSKSLHVCVYLYVLFNALLLVVVMWWRCSMLIIPEALCIHLIVRFFCGNRALVRTDHLVKLRRRCNNPAAKTEGEILPSSINSRTTLHKDEGGEEGGARGGELRESHRLPQEAARRRAWPLPLPLPSRLRLLEP